MHRSVNGLGKSHSRHIYALLGAIGAFLVVGLGPAASGAGAEEEPHAVTIAGSPLTVSLGPLGQCQSSYPSRGNNYFTFGAEGDCGFFLAFPKAGLGQPTALQSKTYGFYGEAGPHLENVYTKGTQSAVSGAGTATDPFTQTTTFTVIDSEKHEDALITEVTTYVNGQPQFTSKYTVENTTASKAAIYFRAVYAGDLFVNGSDYGAGISLGGPSRFIGGQNIASGILGGFVEDPSSPWSAFQEGCWNETGAPANEAGESGRCAGALPADQGIWRDVRSTVDDATAFNNSYDPAAIDNAAGVEWDDVRTTGLKWHEERTFTIINRTQAPTSLQVSPANQTLTQGQTETINVTALDTANQPYAGRKVNYTVNGLNAQSGSVTLNAAGQAQISYVGAKAGIDTIQMYLDLGGSNSQTPNDPAATATVTFLPPPPTPNSTYKVQSIHANSDGTITVVFVPAQGGTAKFEAVVPTGTIARNEAVAARRKAKKCKRNQIRLKGRCRPKTTVSGRVSATGVAGVPLTLTLRPSSKVTKALKRGRTVHLTATLTYISALGGLPTVETFHVTVTGKRKHHRSRKR